MPKKEEIEKKKQSEKDLNILQAIAAENHFASKYGKAGELALNYSKYLQLYKAGLIPEREMWELTEIVYGLLVFLKLYDTNDKRAKTTNTKLKTESAVDTSNLVIGEPYKNYKALCAAVGEKPKGGKAKILQEKRFNRFFEYEKVNGSQQMIVIKIYDEPLKQNENRMTKYVNEVKVLIMYLLYKAMSDNIDDKGVIRYDTTYNRLIAQLNIVNNLIYYNQKLEKEFESKYPTLFEYNEPMNNKDGFMYNYKVFYNVLRNKQKGIISSALDSLSKKEILSFHEKYVIVYRDKKGNISEWFATIKEEATIKQYYRDVSLQMGYKDPQIARFYNQDLFNQLFKQKISTYEGWDSVYYRIIITITYVNLLRYISEYSAIPFDKPINYLTETELNDCKSKLNKTIENDLRNYPNQKHAKELNKVAEYYLDAFYNAGFSDCNIEDIITAFDLNNHKQVKKYGEEFLERINTFIDELVCFKPLEPIPEIAEEVTEL